MDEVISFVIKETFQAVFSTTERILWFYREVQQWNPIPTLFLQQKCLLEIWDVIFFQRTVLLFRLLEGLKAGNQSLTEREKYLQPATDTGQSHPWCSQHSRLIRVTKEGFIRGKIFILTYTALISIQTTCYSNVLVFMHAVAQNCAC